jgi:UDP-perosamine 4-acetyltransferase
MPADDSVVLIGAGPHAKVIADIYESNGIRIAGCLSPRGSNQLPDVPWLGEDADMDVLQASNLSRIHIAVGSNELRRRLAERFVAAGFRLDSAVSRHAVISQKATLGSGVAVMPGAVVNAYASVGDCAIINTSASIDHDCRIGNYAHVGPGCHLAGAVSIEEGVFLGVGCSIIPGIAIGSWSVVGAGSVVVRPVPSSVTAYGVPARVNTHSE